MTLSLLSLGMMNDLWKVGIQTQGHCIHANNSQANLHSSFLRANKLFQVFSARCVKKEKTARLRSHHWILWLPQLQTLRTFQKTAEIHHWENQVHRKLALRRKILPTDQCKVDDNFDASKCRLYAGLDRVNDRVFCGQRDIPAQGNCVNHEWNEHLRSLCRTLHSYLIEKQDELWSHSLLIDPKEDLY